MNNPSPALALFRQFRNSGLVVLGVVSVIAYDYTLTQREKAAKAELNKDKEAVKIVEKK